MIATEDEMVSAKLPIEERDYCAHKKIDYLACRADVWPLAYRCAHSKHELMTCQFDELVIFRIKLLLLTSIDLIALCAFDFCSYVLRMKEYERERRLMLRRQRIAAKANTESLTA